MATDITLGRARELGRAVEVLHIAGVGSATGYAGPGDLERIELGSRVLTFRELAAAASCCACSGPVVRLEGAYVHARAGSVGRCIAGDDSADRFGGPA